MSLADNRTRDVFSRTAASYDSARAKLIPCFEQFYAAAVELVPPDADHILDLGAGTGLLSAFIRERFPAAYLHLIDNAEPMLTQARERFSRDQRVVFQLGDYTIAPWENSYDAIVSALSIHHLTDGEKRKLFARIHEALRPGGVFINAEQILASTPQLEEQARADWLAEVCGLGATEEQVTASLLRQTEDRCATVGEQLLWLNEAGFSETSCAFAQGRFAVLYARHGQT